MHLSSISMFTQRSMQNNNIKSLTIRELVIRLISQVGTKNEDQISRVIGILNERTGKKYANDINKWIEWYLNSQANDEDKIVVKDRYRLFLNEK